MKYAKLINENEIAQLNPNYVEYNDRIYTNPLNNPQIDISALGYKEFVIDDLPTFDKDNETVVRYYQEKNGKIHRSWRVRELTEEEKQALQEMYI